MLDEMFDQWTKSVHVKMYDTKKKKKKRKNFESQIYHVRRCSKSIFITFELGANMVACNYKVHGFWMK